MHDDGGAGAPINAGPTHALERMIFFSDAVFAIAITLLVIELHVPVLPRGSTDRDFLVALINLIPHFAGFLASFFVIGAFWAGHHRAFTCSRHWDPHILMPNLLMLCSVVAMPFFTAFASSYWNQRVPIAAYCSWMLLMALLNMWVQRIAVSPPVVDESITPEQRAMIRVRGQSVALGAATGLVVSLFFPYFGQPALGSIFLWRKLLQRLAHRSQSRG